jgi:hypothetical protein
MSPSVPAIKTSQEIHDPGRKKAAMDAARAPREAHRKKKCVGGGRISITIKANEAISHAFHGINMLFSHSVIPEVVIGPNPFKSNGRDRPMFRDGNPDVLNDRSPLTSCGDETVSNEIIVQSHLITFIRLSGQ